MAPPSTVITKLKVALKLSVSRLRMVQQRETALAKVNRRQMAQLLEQGKEESAKIRVENIIRQDISVELMEILELYCELLLARVQLMEAKYTLPLPPPDRIPGLTRDSRECDPGLEEAIKSIIYAAPRTDIKELTQVRALLVEKYGKEFALAAIDNADSKVSERVLKKLRVEPPSDLLVTLYLKEIARTYGIPWHQTPPSTPPPLDDDDDDEPSTAQPILNDAEAELVRATPPRGTRAPVNIAPPSPSTDNVHPVIKLPDPPAARPQLRKVVAPQLKKSVNPLDDDDLAKRFAALKRL
ncbi:Vacuolar protein sorting-associated protein ist1 [Maublancomyces gigas]|uniref:Vacuolar protein sorting-associated protein ist1 n=1 Tax=Discina gigas TaxID=1032678 RepID=A0ABR3GJ62_9PEZI